MMTSCQGLLLDLNKRFLKRLFIYLIVTIFCSLKYDEVALYYMYTAISKKVVNSQYSILEPKGTVGFK